MSPYVRLGRMVRMYTQSSIALLLLGTVEGHIRE